jgi:predicted Holliday junction resolvase-like endonuclease
MALEAALFALLVFAGLVIVVLLARMESFRARALQRATQEAINRLQTWQARDLEQVRVQQSELARSHYEVELAEWKAEFEAQIRQDAVRKSEVVTLGKVTDHFIPYLPEFTYNPRDARFLGSPIDFLVFDGLSDGEVRSVVFVEIKTGKAALSTRERRIRDAVEAGRVLWQELRPQFVGTASDGGIEDGVAIELDAPGNEAAPGRLE